MTNTIKWLKADRETEIETNDLDATVAYAESLGWSRVSSAENAAQAPGPKAPKT